MSTVPTPPASPKPARYHHAPAQVEAGRTRVMLDLPDAQLAALVQFLTDTLRARPYS